MSDKIEEITSLDELKKAQAAAREQGSGVSNYNEWSTILGELEEAGEKSSGDFNTDKAKIAEIKATVQEYIDNLKVEEAQNQQKEDTQKVKEVSETDNEQNIKAAVATGTSSTITGDLMKCYHMLP